MPAAQWDALHDGAQSVRRACLPGRPGAARLPAPALGLDAAAPDAVGRRRSWSPRRPGTSRHNSHGEFVFDHAWAHAYAQHGLRLLPEVAVRGALLARHRPAPAGARRRSAGARWLEAIVAIVRARRAVVGARQLPSPRTKTHAFDARLAAAHRRAVPLAQRRAAGATSTTSSPRCDHKHRKNIRQERAKVARAGVRFRVVHGDEASDADLADDARLLPADVRRVRQPPGADAGVPAPPGRGDAARAGAGAGRARRRSDRRRAVPARRRHAVRPLLGRERDGARPAFRDLLLPGHRLLPARRPARVSSPARRASTSWRAASCRRSCTAATGSPSRRSREAIARTGARRKRVGACATPRRVAVALAVPRGRADDAAHALSLLGADPACAVPAGRRRAARTRRPAGGRRRPVAAAAAQRLPPRHLPVVFRQASRSCGGARIRAWCSAPTACACRRASAASCGSRDWTVRADTRVRRGDRRLRDASARRPARHLDHRRRCVAAYGELHRLGHAHSVEVFDGERLVGGIYGVAIGADVLRREHVQRASPAAPRSRWPPSPIACATGAGR